MDAVTFPNDAAGYSLRALITRTHPSLQPLPMKLTPRVRPRVHHRATVDASLMRGGMAQGSPQDGPCSDAPPSTPGGVPPPLCSSLPHSTRSGWSGSGA